MKKSTKNNILISSFLLYILISCSTDVQKTPKGHEFMVIRKGDGTIVQPKQFLVIDMVFNDGKDSIWHDTRVQGNPMVIRIPHDSLKAQEEGISEIFRMLSKDDSITFTMPAKMLFENEWKQALPPDVEATENFIFYVGVKEVLDSAQMAIFYEGQRDRQQEARKIKQQEQLEADMAIIDAHLAKKKITAKKTESGLRYRVVVAGKGENIMSGQQVSIHYAGYTLDDVLFDTSIASIAKINNTYVESRPYQPLTLTVGRGQVIPGWEEMILLMNKGSKIRVWIPSPLAYGPRKRSDVILENTILVFDMEVVAIP